MMSSRLLAVAAIALGTIAPFASAAILDQSSVEGGWSFNTGSAAPLAQTFPVTLTGDLSSIVLDLYTFDGVTGPLTFRLLGTTPDGLPDPSNVLATHILPHDSIPIPTDSAPPATTIDLTADAIPVTAGQLLAFSLSADPDSADLNTYGSLGSANIYSQGTLYRIYPDPIGIQDQSFDDFDFDTFTTIHYSPDLAFQTYVTVTPEPACTLLLAPAILLLNRRRRSR